MRFAALLLAIGASCSRAPTREAPPPPYGGPPSPYGEPPSPYGEPPPAAVDAAFAVPPPEPVVAEPPPNAGTCKADASQCCRTDGTIVVPGGCQPVYRDNVQPATRRGRGGVCEPVECNVRCLPAAARIATPDGERAVSRLRVGDAVWTRSAAGDPVVAPVVRLQAIPVLAAHTVREVTLADGRVFRASTGHPLDRGIVGELAVGTAYDRSVVIAVRDVPYAGATWDLLPAGPTGAYWADGVVLGSTLAEPAAGR